jgi:hypothetical protein
MADENKGGAAEGESRRATKADAAKTTKVTIPRHAMVSRGTAYGPGRDIEIPTHVADRLGLSGSKAEARQAKATTRGRKRAAGRKRSS